MMKNLKHVGMVAALAAGAMTMSTSAEARGRYYGHGGDATGAAIAGGVIGLALGAAIASNHHRDYYYDSDYYYGRPRGYYYYESYPRYYYRSYPRGYYYDRRGWGERRGWGDRGGWRGHEGWRDHGGWGHR